MKNLLLIAIIMGSLTAHTQSPRIEFTAPEMYPEGVVYDAGTNAFYVSSVRKGTIGRVDAAGNYKVLLADSTLKSTYGMKVKNNRLWFCAGDPNYSAYSDSSTYKKMIRLVAIDLASGQKTADIDLSGLYPGQHFANDLAIDDNNFVYITDSYSPVIYKVDDKGVASVFAQSEWFRSVGIGLNGIAWHPAGYLLVVNNGNGNILKVDTRDPRRVAKVRIDQFFPGADGILFDGDTSLLLVQNKGVNRVFKLTSTDMWNTAKVVAATPTSAMFSYPATITMKDKQAWVMNAKLHELSDSNVVLSKKFSVQLAEFKMQK